MSLDHAVEYLEDDKRTFTLTDVLDASRSGAFRVREGPGTLNFGYSTSAYWVRIPLHAEPGAEGAWLLEVGYSSLDRVDLFVPDGNGGYAHHRAGDLQPFAERPFPHRHLIFPLIIAADQPQILYLRVQSQGNLTIPLALWRPAALSRADHRTYSALALYFGALLALAVYNFLLFLAIRELSYLYYVGFAIALAVGQASLYGTANEFLWPANPQWGNAALAAGFGATGVFAALFTRSFLNTRQSMPWLDKIILSWAAWFAFCAFAAFISYRLGAVMVSLAGVTFSLVAVAGGVLCYRRKVPGAGYFLLAWTFPLLGAVVTGSRNFNLIPATSLTNHAIQVGSVLEMVLLSFALADRINTARREKERAQADALQTKQEIVTALQRSEQQLEARVAQRTRELADAYARLQKTEQALRNLAYQDNLTGLANRILVEDRLSRAIAQAKRDGSSVAVLVLDLDRFKSINDKYGHAVGDEVLKTAAQRILGCVRNSDTVARIGGDEFLIVLEGMQAAGGAERVADAIIEALSTPIAVDQLAVTVGVSIGIGLYPTHAEELKALIKHADETMYKMKTVARSDQNS